MKALTIAALLIGALAVPAKTDGVIHLQYVDCATHNASALRIRLHDLLNKESSSPQFTTQPTNLGFAIELHLNPGFYSLDVDHGECGGHILLPVLAGHNQNVSLIGWSGVVLTESDVMVAGTVPISGLQVSIVYYPQDQTGGVGPTHLVLDPARVDGDAYYATGLASGTARLRLSSADGTHWVEVKLGEIGPERQRFVLFNVTERDIENAIHAASPAATPSGKS